MREGGREGGRKEGRKEREGGREERGRETGINREREWGFHALDHVLSVLTYRGADQNSLFRGK